MRALTVAAPILILLSIMIAAAAPDPPLDDVTITGRVIDDASGRPVQSAQVFIPALDVGALTDASGTYSLLIPQEVVPEGDIVVVAQRLGYQEAHAEVVVRRDGLDNRVRLDFRLHQAALQLGEAIVTGRDHSDGTAIPTPLAELSPGLRMASGAAVRSGPAFSRTGGTDFNREQYAHIEENGFRAVTDHALSTFSIDVDRASYSNVRRILREGRLPPIDAVQVEEMINYFPYEYDLPDGEHPLAVTTEVGPAPWAENHRLIRIGLATPEIETEELPATNLVFLLDVSGSMQSPDKLPLVKRSMRLLVNELRSEDRVAIVVYAGAAGLVLESTPGSDKERILEAIESLEAGGSTAGGAGIQLAYHVARENFIEGGNNRVVLATDGDFNVGASSDSEMVRLIEEKREEGTFLTVLGFGTGNIQTSKMQSLAQHGNGNWGYIDSLDEARKMLVSEMGGTLLTVAQDVKLQVEFNPSRVRAYRLIGYENRLLANEDFNDDTKDAGELGAGHRVTALYEVVPAGADSDVRIPGVDPLRYQDADVSAADELDELAFVRVRYQQPGGSGSRLLEHPVTPGDDRVSEDFRFASAVAGFGMLLRESEHRGSITPQEVLTLATEGLGRDREGYRHGFLQLVRTYMNLADGAVSQ